MGSTGSAMKNKVKIGIASDHAGFEMKSHLSKLLIGAGYEVNDFGNNLFQPEDDYPDYVAPLARAIARQDIIKGIAICGSGVGACITGNKVAGVRACLICENFSARQGVEDDNMNMMCLGAKITDPELAWELTQTFIASAFSGKERHLRRLAKIEQLENNSTNIV